MGRTRLLGRFVSGGPAKPREFGRTAMAFGKIWENSTCCFMPLYVHFCLGIFLFQCFSPSTRLTQKKQSRDRRNGTASYHNEGSSIMTNKQHNLRACSFEHTDRPASLGANDHMLTNQVEMTGRLLGTDWRLTARGRLRSYLLTWAQHTSTNLYRIYL